MQEGNLVTSSQNILRPKLHLKKLGHCQSPRGAWLQKKPETRVFGTGVFTGSAEHF